MMIAMEMFYKARDFVKVYLALDIPIPELDIALKNMYIEKIPRYAKASLKPMQLEQGSTIINSI